MGDVFSKNSVVIPVFTIPSATFRHVIDFFMNLNSMSRLSLKPAKLCCHLVMSMSMQYKYKHTREHTYNTDHAAGASAWIFHV